MDEIKELLKYTIYKKFDDYEKTKEPAYMPFHTALLGKDRLALYQFIHSLNTNFGTTIFEPVGVLLAQNFFDETKKQEDIGKEVYEGALRVIDEIIIDLERGATKPNKLEEIEKIRKNLFIGKLKKVKLTKVDLFCKKENNIFMFDIKTAKPNKGAFIGFKRMLLLWCAAYLTQYPDTNVNSFIAIPYNPYYPKPYSRWTMAGMLDLENELKVAEEFWDFLGGSGSYENLLKIFEEVGKEMREEIDEYFKRFRKE